nr:DNA translocase FtsK [uncultured Olsenella sp.]
MPSNRSSNAQKGRRKKNGGRRAGGRGPSPQRLLPAKGSVGSDILGVALLVVAIALGIAVLLPSSAPVTRACGETLSLLFGVGAFLLPLALAIFSLTFFVDGEGPMGSRVALGLLLVVLAVLGLLSVNMASATEADPLLVFDKEAVLTRGGYVGAAIAWALLSLMGRTVGNVVLVGVALTGAIVCGFSVSGAVSRLREASQSAREGLQERVRRRQAGRSPIGGGEAPYPDYADPLAPEVPAEGATTFLGARKTSVLTRGGRTRADGTDSSDDAGGGTFAEPKTTLLRRLRHPNIDLDVARPAGEVATTPPIEGLEMETERTPSAPAGSHADLDVEGADEEVAVPDFLQAVAPTQRLAGRRRGTRRSEDARPTPKKPSLTARNAPVSHAERAVPAQAAMSPAPAPRPRPATPAPAGKRPGEGEEGYQLPPLSMLSSNPNSATSAASIAELSETKDRLQATLQEFGLRSQVVDYVSGPLVTTFRVEMGEGERVNKIRNLEDDIALTLAAEKVRIFAPIPGTSYVGIEIPNKERENVHLGDVLPYAKGGPLEVAIGRDSAGKPVVTNIAKMPHMLVAGTTGSGKSVLINSMIMSLLMRTTPKQVRLIMIDPKRVEFAGYNGLPHLYVPVVTEPRQAASALQWAVSEMERRLKVFERAGAREIRAYNKMCVSGKLSEMDNPPDPLPYIVVVIDELSDLMMVAGKDVEASIVRIAQLARAAGIHLVIATQRPSANVVTGLIKSNIDSRVALKVSSGIDSRVILDETGADKLLGNGDMLFKDRGLSPKRVLGCYTSDQEINEVVDFIRSQGEPDYHEEILSQVVPGQPSGSPLSDGEEGDDPLVWEAAQIVVDSRLGSTSGLQRRLKVGYARAGRIMDMLESKGVVGPPDGSKPREVLLDKEGLEDLRVQEEKYREV